MEVNSNSKKLRVMLVEDHELTRLGLRSALQQYSSLEVVAEAENGQQAVDYVALYKPHLVLMDVCMPVMDGLTALKEVKTRYPTVKVVMLTSLNARGDIYKAFQSGANGYCTKEISPQELFSGMKVVMSNHTYLDPSIAGLILQGGSNNIESSVHLSLNSSGEDIGVVELEKILSVREIEIVKLISKNKHRDEIALELGLKPSWVNGHIENILLKLSAANAEEMVNKIAKIC